MMTLLLAACIGQVTHADFEFIQAQEAWVIDSLQPPKPLHWYLPKDVYAQVNILYDDCPRCRARAFDDLVAMGPDVIRWMLWVRRAKNHRVANDAEEVIARLALCRVCNGSGVCPGYSAAPGGGDYCANCHYMQYHHEFDALVRFCKHCSGRGFFKTEPSPAPAAWEVGG